MASRDEIISKVWREIEVVVGNWMFEDQSEEQRRLQGLILSIIQNRAVPLSVAEDIGDVVRAAFDLGCQRRRNRTGGQTCTVSTAKE